MDKKGLKKQIIDIGKRIWTRGYVAANDGNISVKIDANEFLTTATGISKGFMTKEMILHVNEDGELLEDDPEYKPSSELKMHLEVYKMREDIGSVVHAHPPFATSFAVANQDLDQYILPEAVITLGSVPVAEYATPSTMEIPESIKPYITKTDAVLLQNHGALTLGTDLETAYFRMEILEHYAQILYRAKQLGNVNALSQEQIDDLIEIRSKLNVPGRIFFKEDDK